MREFYSTLDVSGICGVDPVTVARWCDRGDLACYKTPGGHRRIRRQELLGFLKKHGMEVPPQLARPALKVLAVLPDARVLAALRKRYANHGGRVELVPTANMIDGLIQFGAAAPAVVLLDLDVTDVDALAVCRQIRGTHSGIKVIAVTGDKAKQKLAMRSGVDAVLSKPLDLKALDTHILPQPVIA